MYEELTDRVFALVGMQTAARREKLSLETDLFGDLGVDGDDAHELLSIVADEFGVNMDTLKFERHFGPESWFNPFALLFPSWWRWHRERVPIRIRDLVEAARAGKWTIRYPTERAT